jgi:hypothetical protein
MTDYEIKNIIKIWVSEVRKETKLKNDNWIVTCIHDCHGVMSMNQYSMTRLYNTEEARRLFGRHGEIIINLVAFEMQYREIENDREAKIKENIKRHLLYEFQEAAHYDYLLHQDIIDYDIVEASLTTNAFINRNYAKLVKTYCNKTVDTHMINTSCGHLEAFLLNNYKKIMEVSMI